MSSILILIYVKNQLLIILQGEKTMTTIKNYFQTKSFQTLTCFALTVATLAANSRCAYIYHDPKKPAELQHLKKF